MSRSIPRLLIAMTLLTAIGCPDFSHQAPRPDYSNMSDEGADTADGSD